VPPLDQFLGPLGGFLLALTALGFLAREYRRQINERVSNLRADMEYERARAAKAEERLDLFRGQSEEMTDVLRQAVAFAERVIDERRR
jgi:hypothetical protein